MLEEIRKYFPNAHKMGDKIVATRIHPEYGRETLIFDKAGSVEIHTKNQVWETTMEELCAVNTKGDCFR